MNLGSLLIQESSSNPFIYFNADTGILEISGFAGLKPVEEYEESVEHWLKSLNWVEQYIMNPKPNTQFICKLKFFNTMTPKYLLKIIRTLETLQEPFIVGVYWFVQSDDESIVDFIDDMNGVLSKLKIQVVFE